MKKIGIELAVCALLLAVPVPVRSQNAVRGVNGTDQVGRAPSAGRTRLLQVPEVQRELNLSPKQLKEIQDTRQSMQLEMLTYARNIQRLPREKRAEKQPVMLGYMDRLDQRILKVLNDSQRLRLRQIHLQQEGSRALARPDVIAELNLSQDQRKKIDAALEGERTEWTNVVHGKGGVDLKDRKAVTQKLLDLRKETDSRLLAVLNDSQKNRYQALRGAPFSFAKRAPQDNTR